MKKLILIMFGLISAHAYSYDATRGALQNDPTLCQYGYNPNCVSNTRSAPSTEIIYYNVDVKVPPLFAALAFSSQASHIAGAANQDSLDMAKKKAIKKCQEGSHNTPCKVVIWVKNACLAAAVGKIKEKYILSTGGGDPGEAEENALRDCRKKGAKECRIIQPEVCSIPDLK